MTPTEVIEHFGSIPKVAKALDVSYQAVAQWVEKGEVPEVRQWHVHAASGGVLQVDEKKSA